MIRRFRVPEGRELILPVDLTEGTHHTGIKGGNGPESVIDIDDDRINKALCHRYIRNRLALGDLVELEYTAPSATTEPEAPPLPNAPASRSQQARMVAAPGTPSDPNPFAKE